MRLIFSILLVISVLIGFEASAQSGMPPVYLKFRTDKIYILNEERVEFFADVYIGTWESPVQNLYALSLDLIFPTDIVQAELTKFSYNTQSFLGEDVTVINKAPEAVTKGQLNISISRTNNKGANGFGKIGTVQYVTVHDIIGSRQVDEIPFTVKAEYVKLLDVDGRELPNETDADGATIIIVNDILARNARTANARQVSIYPNPARDQLYIQLQNLRGEEIEIFNINGQRVKSDRVQGDQAQISTKDLRPGVYMIKIHTEEGIITRRVLLQ